MRRQRQWFPLAVLVCLAAALAASCASAPKQPPQEKLVGTWSNPEYLGGRSFTPWRIAYNADGTASRWNFDDPAVPGRVARYVVEKTWTGDDGSTWYRLEETWSSAQFTDETVERWSTLVRIDPEGTTMERQASAGDFPAALAGSIAAGGYGTYSRQ
jgi:hypothetical protein